MNIILGKLPYGLTPLTIVRWGILPPFTSNRRLQNCSNITLLDHPAAYLCWNMHSSCNNFLQHWKTCGNSNIQATTTINGEREEKAASHSFGIFFTLTPSSFENVPCSGWLSTAREITIKILCEYYYRIAEKKNNQQ